MHQGPHERWRPFKTRFIVTSQKSSGQLSIASMETQEEEEEETQVVLDGVHGDLGPTAVFWLPLAVTRGPTPIFFCR